MRDALSTVSLSSCTTDTFYYFNVFFESVVSQIIIMSSQMSEEWLTTSHEISTKWSSL